MQISGLHIERFGIWSDLTLRDLPNGATVFYGPNEAGKSTLMQFVRTMLYGFHPDRCRRFVSERRQQGTLIQPRGRLGGSLHVADRDGEFQIRRFAQETDPLGSPGDVQLTSTEGERFGAQRLATLLSGIDDTIYLNVFAVGLSEMQAISSLQDTEAARQLYSLSTGADRVSLVDIMRQLAATNDRIVGSDDRRSLLQELVQKKNQCLHDLKQQQSAADRWARLVTERKGLNEEIARLDEQGEQLRRSASLADAALRLHPKWELAQQLSAELERLGHVTPIRRRLVEALNALDAEIQEAEEQLSTLRQKQDRLESRLREKSADKKIGRQAVRIGVLLEQKSSLDHVEERLKQLARDRDDAELEIAAEQERLGLQATSSNESQLFPLDASALASLQEPALALDREKEKLESHSREAASYREDAERLGRELASAMGRDGASLEGPPLADVRDAWEQTSGMATGLRRGREVRDTLEGIRRRKQETDQRHADLLANQLMPWELVRALGVLFTLGAVLFASGLFGQTFGWTDPWRGLLMLGGAVAVALAAVLKLSLDHPARDEIRDAARRSDQLAKQILDLEDELTALGEQLPSTSIAGDDPRTDLVRLQALMPLEEQRRQLVALAEQSERNLVDRKRALQTASDRWQKVLRDAGLPLELTPQQLSALTGQSGSLRRLHEQLLTLDEERSRLEKEQHLWLKRVVQLLGELGDDREVESLSAGWKRLAEAQEKHAEQEKAQATLRGAQESLRREHSSAQRACTALLRKRDTLIASSGAVDRDDLERLRLRERKARKKKAELDKVRQQIERALRDDAQAKLIRRELSQFGEEDLTRRRQRAQRDHEEMTNRLQQLKFRQGELGEQIRQLAADRSAAATQLELGLLDHQIADCIQRWQVVNAMSGMLRTVYKKYEKERQPATLKEASQFLHQMTDGRYERIWTPLSEDVLLVDDREGRAAPIEQLSRGTREQLFLSLRLALIADYARRGVKMPVILDDVLVNFDAERTAAAASVLVDFARSGYQTLVFTCHPHIRDLFQQLQVDVRELGPATPKAAEKAVPEKAATKATPNKAAVTIGYADPSEGPHEDYMRDWWFPADTEEDGVRLGFARTASEAQEPSPQLPSDF